MSEPSFLASIAPLADNVDAAVATAATRLGNARASRIAVVSAGAVQATDEQRAAIVRNTSEELLSELGEQLADVVRVFVLNLSQRKE